MSITPLFLVNTCLVSIRRSWQSIELPNKRVMGNTHNTACQPYGELYRTSIEVLFLLRRRIQEQCPKIKEYRLRTIWTGYILAVYSYREGA